MPSRHTEDEVNGGCDVECFDSQTHIGSTGERNGGRGNYRGYSGPVEGTLGHLGGSPSLHSGGHVVELNVRLPQEMWD